MVKCVTDNSLGFLTSLIKDYVKVGDISLGELGYGYLLDTYVSPFDSDFPLILSALSPVLKEYVTVGEGTIVFYLSKKYPFVSGTDDNPEGRSPIVEFISDDISTNIVSHCPGYSSLTPSEQSLVVPAFIGDYTSINEFELKLHIPLEIGSASDAEEFYSKLFPSEQLYFTTTQLETYYEVSSYLTSSYNLVQQGPYFWEYLPNLSQFSEHQKELLQSAYPFPGNSDYTFVRKYDSVAELVNGYVDTPLLVKAVNYAMSSCMFSYTKHVTFNLVGEANPFSRYKFTLYPDDTRMLPIMFDDYLFLNGNLLGKDSWHWSKSTSGDLFFEKTTETSITVLLRSPISKIFINGELVDLQDDIIEIDVSPENYLLYSSLPTLSKSLFAHLTESSQLSLLEKISPHVSISVEFSFSDTQVVTIYPHSFSSVESSGIWNFYNSGAKISIYLAKYAYTQRYTPYTELLCSQPTVPDRLNHDCYLIELEQGETCSIRFNLLRRSARSWEDYNNVFSIFIDKIEVV